MTDFRLEAALKGDLRQYMREELASAERAVTGGVREGADEVKRALRADVIGAGLGARLAKTWRSSDYPRSGYSLGAASEAAVDPCLR
jgi:hypothetical protein